MLFQKPVLLHLCHPSPFSSPFFRLPSLRTSPHFIPQLPHYSLMHVPRPGPNWKFVYKMIRFREKQENNIAYLLSNFELEGHRLTMLEVITVIRKLKKSRRYKQALEVYEWMRSKGTFRFSAVEISLHIHLIARVRGISSAEECFQQLPYFFRQRDTCLALLNAYGRNQMQEKAELFFQKMRRECVRVRAATYNTMMTMYLRTKQYSKVESVILDMKADNVQLDANSYDIWLSSLGAQKSREKLEQVYEELRLDRVIIGWLICTTVASAYIKLELIDKVKVFLKKAERRVRRDHLAYDRVIHLYGVIGSKEDVYRMWDVYNFRFPIVRNQAYRNVLRSLLLTGDTEGAEKIYSHWLMIKVFSGPGVGNVFISWYVKKRMLPEALCFCDKMIEMGEMPNARTWEILARGYLRAGETKEALYYLNKAISHEGRNPWRPKWATLSVIVQQCKEESDTGVRQLLMEFLRKVDNVEDETLASFRQEYDKAPESVAEYDDEYDDDGDVDEGDNNDDNDEDEVDLILDGSDDR